MHCWPLNICIQAWGLAWTADSDIFIGILIGISKLTCLKKNCVHHPPSDSDELNLLLSLLFSSKPFILHLDYCKKFIIHLSASILAPFESILNRANRRIVSQNINQIVLFLCLKPNKSFPLHLTLWIYCVYTQYSSVSIPANLDHIYHHCSP